MAELIAGYTGAMNRPTSGSRKAASGRRELSMAFLSSHANAEEPRRKTFFDGERSRIDFTSLAHRRIIRGAKEGDAEEIGYQIGRDRRYPGVRVLLRRGKTPLDDQPGKGGEEEVLATHVRRLVLSYWDANDEDWKSEWSVDFEDIIDPAAAEKGAGLAEEDEGFKQTMLPYRVRIQLTLEDVDGEDLVLETQTPIFMRRAFRFKRLEGAGRAVRPSLPGSALPTAPRAVSPPPGTIR